MKTFRRLSEESPGRRWRLVTASCFVFRDVWRWRLQAIEPMTLMRVDPARGMAYVIGDGNLELESRRKYSGGDRRRPRDCRKPGSERSPGRRGSLSHQAAVGTRTGGLQPPRCRALRQPPDGLDGAGGHGHPLIRDAGPTADPGDRQDGRLRSMPAGGSISSSLAGPWRSIFCP
jgi:hypothetical protein